MTNFLIFSERKTVVKTAAELLEASKRFYVKSENVLEKRQEWNSGVKKFAPNVFIQSENNNHINYKWKISQSFSFERDSLKKPLPPPVPPKNGRIFQKSGTNIFLVKPPIPPKPKKISFQVMNGENKNGILPENEKFTTENNRFIPKNDHLITKCDHFSKRSSREDLKNCFISLIVPSGTVENGDLDGNFSNSNEITSMGSSPNLHINQNLHSTYPSASDADRINNPPKKIAYSKRRKSMPNLAGVEQISRLTFDESEKKFNEEENDTSTVGADDGSSSARWDISIVSGACVDNQSDISACESLTSSPRRQSNGPPPTPKRFVSLSSTESDGQLNRHLPNSADEFSAPSDNEYSSKSSSTALHKFFNSMGLEKNVWQKINGDDLESVQYFSTVSSVPSSVTFSKNSDSNSDGDQNKRRRSQNSTVADSNRADRGSFDNSNKQVSIIERNARVIKWIYACGKPD